MVYCDWSVMLVIIRKHNSQTNSFYTNTNVNIQQSDSCNPYGTTVSECDNMDQWFRFQIMFAMSIERERVKTWESVAEKERIRGGKKEMKQADWQSSKIIANLICKSKFMIFSDNLSCI